MGPIALEAVTVAQQISMPLTRRGWSLYEPRDRPAPQWIGRLREIGFPGVLAMQYPEIATAAISGPEPAGNMMKYNSERAARRLYRLLPKLE